MLIIDKFLNLSPIFFEKLLPIPAKILIIKFDKIIYREKSYGLFFIPICMPRCVFFYNFTIQFLTKRETREKSSK